MELSIIWRGLPVELVEEIFTHIVESYFFVDPAYTWVRLRQLSGHQKRVIERDFNYFWLPKLNVTLYASPRCKYDYGLDYHESEVEEDTVTFDVKRRITNPLLGISETSMPSSITQNVLHRSWQRYDPATSRVITVRLGEGYLNAGLRGGFILNDTDIPGLELWLDKKWKIRFPWKETMNELLREEMYMRAVGEKMFADACEKWCANPINAEDVIVDDSTKTRLPPLHIQVRLWRLFVQCPRRVVALKHRVAKSQATSRPLKLNFAAISEELHRQEPCEPVVEDEVDEDDGSEGLCWCWQCREEREERQEDPDIFEVVHVEESAVPHLDIFKRWLAAQGPEPNMMEEYWNEGENAWEIISGGVSLGDIRELYEDEYAYSYRLYVWNEEEEGTLAQKEKEAVGYKKAKDMIATYPRDMKRLMFLGHAKDRWSP